MSKNNRRNPVILVTFATVNALLACSAFAAETKAPSKPPKLEQVVVAPKATIGQYTELSLELAIEELRKKLRDAKESANKLKGGGDMNYPDPIHLVSIPPSNSSKSGIKTPTQPAPTVSDFGVNWTTSTSGKYTALLRDGRRVASGDTFTQKGITFKVLEITNTGVRAERCEESRCTTINAQVGG